MRWTGPTLLLASLLIGAAVRARHARSRPEPGACIPARRCPAHRAAGRAHPLDVSRGRIDRWCPAGRRLRPWGALRLRCDDARGARLHQHRRPRQHAPTRGCDLVTGRDVPGVHGERVPDVQGCRPVAHGRHHRGRHEPRRRWVRGDPAVRRRCDRRGRDGRCVPRVHTRRALRQLLAHDVGRAAPAPATTSRRCRSMGPIRRASRWSATASASSTSAWRGRPMVRTSRTAITSPTPTIRATASGSSTPTGRIDSSSPG